MNGAAIQARLKKNRLLDVSNGFKEISEWGGEQIDDGNVGCSVSISSGTGPCGLEDAVQSFEAGIGVGRFPALDDALDVGGDGAEGAANGIEQRGGVKADADMIDEARNPPARSLRGISFADPAQHLLGTVGGGGSEAAGLQLGERDTLVIGEVTVAGPEDGPADGLG